MDHHYHGDHHGAADGPAGRPSRRRTPASDGEPPPPQPPPAHPIAAAAYERGARLWLHTACVTRALLTAATVSYGASWFIHRDHYYYALACLPLFAVQAPWYEGYRLLTGAWLVNDRLGPVMLALAVFAHTGTILEQSVGSMRVAGLAVAVTVAANALFCAACLLLSRVGGGGGGDARGWTVAGSAGVWTTLSGLVALECGWAARHMPTRTTRKVLLLDVPIQYVPLALLGLSSLLAGRVQGADAISTALGYAAGAWLYRAPGPESLLPLLLYPPRFAIAVAAARILRAWDEAAAHRLRGWVPATAATGAAAWQIVDGDDGDESAAVGGGRRQEPQSPWSSLFQGPPLVGGEGHSGLRSGWTPSASTSSMERSAGRTLGSGGGGVGGPSPRPNAAEARAARLHALERRDGV